MHNYPKLNFFICEHIPKIFIFNFNFIHSSSGSAVSCSETQWIRSLSRKHLRVKQEYSLDGNSCQILNIGSYFFIYINIYIYFILLITLYPIVSLHFL